MTRSADNSAAAPASQAEAPPRAGKASIPASRVVVQVRDLNVSYGKNQALFGVTMDIQSKAVTAIIGPSGCGKSTLLRCVNRMNELIDGVQVDGHLVLEGQDVYGPDVDPVAVRRHIGMVFQKPNPFPKSIFENVAYGLRIRRKRKGDRSVDDTVEWALRRAYLWDEVKDKLHESGASLSGGQQQRLCIARALAVQPDILLMDEPCSALDPIATGKIEDLILDLKRDYTIVIVTHNMQQASRVGDWVAFMHLGKLIEYDTAVNIFERPRHELTERYVTGRFG